MNRTFFLIAGLAGITICCWAFINIKSNNIVIPEEGITFHEVPLVCNAAPDIGCGSRSKPILLDLQQDLTIKEAWLNRQGTITAIVWEKGVEYNLKIVPEIFKKHGKSFKTLKGKKHNSALASFRNEKWYKGTEVDELSIEEAGQIAEQIIDQLLEFKVLPEDKSAEMETEVKNYIKNEFLNLENINLLNSPEYYEGWEKAIRRIGANYLKGEMPEMEVFYPAGSSCKKKNCSPKYKKVES